MTTPEQTPGFLDPPPTPLVVALLLALIALGAALKAPPADVRACAKPSWRSQLSGVERVPGRERPPSAGADRLAIPARTSPL
jgi:hypothetical protein